MDAGGAGRLGSMTQTSQTLRSAEDLIKAGLTPEARRAEIDRVGQTYAIGVTPTIAALIELG